MSDDYKKNSMIPPTTSEFLLSEILTKLNKADVLNGGFDRLSSEVSSMKKDMDDIKSNFHEVETDLKLIKKVSEDKEQTLEKIHDALYHPFTGIYSNMQKSDNNLDKLANKISSLESKIDSTNKDLNATIIMAEQKLNKRADETDGKFKIIKEIGGDEALTSIKDAVETHKNMSKMWWALILAVVSGFGKFLWDVVKELN